VDPSFVRASSLRLTACDGGFGLRVAAANPRKSRSLRCVARRTRGASAKKKRPFEAQGKRAASVGMTGFCLWLRDWQDSKVVVVTVIGVWGDLATIPPLRRPQRARPAPVGMTVFVLVGWLVAKTLRSKRGMTGSRFVGSMVAKTQRLRPLMPQGLKPLASERVTARRPFALLRVKSRALPPTLRSPSEVPSSRRRVLFLGLCGGGFAFVSVSRRNLGRVRVGGLRLGGLRLGLW